MQRELQEAYVDILHINNKREDQTGRGMLNSSGQGQYYMSEPTCFPDCRYDVCLVAPGGSVLTDGWWICYYMLWWIAIFSQLFMSFLYKFSTPITNSKVSGVLITWVNLRYKEYSFETRFSTSDMFKVVLGEGIGHFALTKEDDCDWIIGQKCIATF